MTLGFSARSLLDRSLIRSSLSMVRTGTECKVGYKPVGGRGNREKSVV